MPLGTDAERLAQQGLGVEMAGLPVLLEVAIDGGHTDIEERSHISLRQTRVDGLPELAAEVRGVRFHSVVPQILILHAIGSSDSTYHDRMVRVSAERFEELTSQVIEELPAWVKQQMDNVHVAVEDRPPADQPGLLGLYQGVPLTQRGGHFTGLPDTITLYQSTIEREAATEADLATALRHVILHEVAHLMGISDQRLIDLGRY